MALPILVALCLGVFVEVAGLKLSSVPQIYPQKIHEVVNAHTNLVLGCRGAEPLRWTFHDDVNGRHYNSFQKNISYMNNNRELEYKFETILTIYNVSHLNVGFYYCHGVKPNFDTPRRSSRIYVFVHDDNNLSVITSKKYRVYSYLWFAQILCRPTSPDINITLECTYGFSMFVTPYNYSEFRKTKDYNIRFDLYEGFSIRSSLMHVPLRCSCFFRRGETSFSFETKFFSDQNILIDPPHIDGSSTVNMGDNITLQGTAIRDLYLPYCKYGLQWEAPLKGNFMVTNYYTLKLKHYLILINTLIIKNVSSEDEGYYWCATPNYAGKANKYVAVQDKQASQRPPRIYSDFSGSGQEEIQLNSGDNITLRCEGSRPVTWSWGRDEQYIPYNNTHITYQEKNGFYYSFLLMAPVYYTNTEFYYCHEKDFVKKHPLRSNQFYIFVKDEQNLHVPQHRNFGNVYAYANVTVPCRPTSRDVNVTLSMTYKVRNWIYRRTDTMRINPRIYAYDYREGFAVQMPQEPVYLGLFATCTFITGTFKSTLELEYNIVWLKSEPNIEGPRENFVFVGDTLELFCTVVVLNNIPDDALRWTIQNNSSSSNITVEKINVNGGRVLISKLFIYNVKNIDEGKYTCYLPYNNATASKFISVYDGFDVKPYIENLTYYYAYIGQPLILQCGANVSHNVDFNMTWTAPNATEKHINIMDIEYTLDVRHRKGEITLEIVNVTYENEGNYSCYVSDFKNGIANITKFVQVKRGKAPTMKSASSDVNNPENVEAVIYKAAKLTCPAEGDPKPTITWMNGSTKVQSLGQRIDFSADNSELTILLVQRFDTGLYTCVAQNPYGKVSHVVLLRVKSESFSGGMIAGIICMVIAVIALIVLAVAFAKFEYKKQRRRKALLEDGFDNFKLGEAEQAALSAYDMKWEIPRNKIKLDRNLGSGYFGLVVQATVSNYSNEEPVKKVAVKMLHQNCNNITALHSLLSELKIMANLGKHANLINLLGACTENIADRGLLVVIEYCEHGSLRSYLLENRSNFVNLIDPETELINDVEDADTRTGGSGSVTTLDLLRWALQVARAMEFLASRKVVHGDLAARNVLLTENYVVKISDFGLSRNLSSNDYYRKRSQCPLPVMWMALESIRDKTFSTWSDVWSFGVVLWELFSLARTPYGELEPDFRFYRKLESGYRLYQPRYSTKEIYQVMRECWYAQPQRRPTFPRLVRTLDDLLQEVHARWQHHDVDVSDECSILPSIRDRDDLKTAHEWIALDVLASTETFSNM